MKSFKQFLVEATEKIVTAPDIGSQSEVSKKTKHYEIHHEVGDDDTHNIYHGHFHGHKFHAEVNHGESHHGWQDGPAHFNEHGDMPAHHKEALAHGLKRHAKRAYARWEREGGRDW